MAFVNEPTTGQTSDNASVERTLVDVQDVMDIGLRKTEPRVLDQSLHLVIVLPLIDAVRKHLETIIKGKGQRLWVLLLYFKLFHEFADIQKTKLSSGFLI